MRVTTFFLAVLSLCPLAAAAESDAPLTVSPGNAARISMISGPCPVFSWGEIDGADRYELVVYRLGDGGERAQPVLQKRFAGSVESWTPALDSCLERGARYAWIIRAVVDQRSTEWSAARMFQIQRGPSEEEFSEALEIVRSYLATRGEGEAELTEEQERTSARAPESQTPASSGLTFSGEGDDRSWAAPGAETERPGPSGDVPEARVEALAPAVTSFVTDGAVGIGVAAPAADLHVVGGSTVGSILIAPDEPQSNRDSELILGEDDDGTYAMRLFYDGGSNLLQVWGRNATGGDLGPWLEISRDDGRIGAEKWNPDPPCFNATQRFVDCGNGTVTDTITGLVYLKKADCFGLVDWPAAQAAARDLAHGSCELSDGSRKGDWRLQTRAEWLAIIRAGCSSVPKLEGNNHCYSEPGSAWALGVQNGDYWTSSTYEFGPPYDYAHFVSLDDGADHNVKLKTETAYVWPVRSGEGEFSP